MVRNEGNVMDTTPTITATEAQLLLDRADRLSRSAHDATKWPYISFILALGVATSMGTLAMGATTGDAFGLAYFGTLTAVFAVLMFFMISIRGRSAFSRSRRWIVYIASWFVTYAAALAVMIFAHGAVLPQAVASGLVLAVSIGCAAREARS